MPLNFYHFSEFSVNSFGSTLSDHRHIVELAKDTVGVDEGTSKLQTSKSYVSQAAVALRCRVIPPPCIKNPYLKNASEMDTDPFGNQRSKCAGNILFVILFLPTKGEHSTN